MRWTLALVAIGASIGCDRAAPAPIEPPSYVAYAKGADDPTTIVPASYSTCVAALTGGTYEVEHDGRVRTFAIDLPEGGGLRPMVLAFHGWGGDPDQLERTTRIAERGVARGFVVVRPLGLHKSFDAGTCCGDAAEQKVDDVGFARALVPKLARQACVDTARVYATGFSNGGFLAHRLGCEAADTFAAIASVAGTLGVSTCAPTRPVPVLQIHGKADRVVPFSGDAARGWRSVASTIERWVHLNRCSTEGSEETYAKGAARCVRTSSCDAGAEVVLCRDDRAAHTWPGGPKSFGFGGSQDLDATETILEFFTRHATPR